MPNRLYYISGPQRRIGETTDANAAFQSLVKSDQQVFYKLVAISTYVKNASWRNKPLYQLTPEQAAFFIPWKNAAQRYTARQQYIRNNAKEYTIGYDTAWEPYIEETANGGAGIGASRIGAVPIIIIAIAVIAAVLGTAYVITEVVRLNNESDIDNKALDAQLQWMKDHPEDAPQVLGLLQETLSTTQQPQSGLAGAFDGLTTLIKWGGGLFIAYKIIEIFQSKKQAAV